MSGRSFPTNSARLLGSLALVLFAGACQTSSAPIACTEEFRYGISVLVQDSVTGASVASGARLITVRDGVVVDSGLGPPSAWPANQPSYNTFALSGAGELPGRFDLTVKKPGYRDWQRAGVQVTADVCHVRGVGLTARLQPLP